MNNENCVSVEIAKPEESIKILLGRLSVLVEEMDMKTAEIVDFLGDSEVDKCNMPECPQITNAFTHLQAIEYEMQNALRKCDRALKILGL